MNIGRDISLRIRQNQTKAHRYPDQDVASFNELSVDRRARSVVASLRARCAIRLEPLTQTKFGER